MSAETTDVCSQNHFSTAQLMHNSPSIYFLLLFFVFLPVFP